MYHPTYKDDRENLYFLPDFFHLSDLNPEEARVKGIIGQDSVLFLTYTGEVHWITDLTELFLCKTPSGLMLGLLKGEEYDKMRDGNLGDNTVNFGDIFLKYNVFITYINNNMAVAIYLDENNDGMVVFTAEKNDALTPDEADLAANELRYAAEAARQDSFMMKALMQTFSDDEISPEARQQFLTNLRELREETLHNAEDALAEQQSTPTEQTES